MTAQDFIKEFAPHLADKQSLDMMHVYALMEAFKSHEMIEFIDTKILPKQDETIKSLQDSYHGIINTIKPDEIKTESITEIIKKICKPKSND